MSTGSGDEHGRPADRDDPVDTDPGPAHADEMVATAAQGPSGPAQLPRTGEPRVDDAIASLGALEELPTSEHADVFEDVHRRLHGALTDLDTD